ncbi:NBAS subunit of NRZ tethering complex-like [Brevipalpus obovatus]|uniref:NBAS subunit of NRZ tethering complex-like n=1 Tax=Brevipalpus obovatus TaxID=246614 RepID=UPI003D9EED72
MTSSFGNELADVEPSGWGEDDDLDFLESADYQSDHEASKEIEAQKNEPAQQSADQTKIDSNDKKVEINDDSIGKDKIDQEQCEEIVSIGNSVNDVSLVDGGRMSKSESVKKNKSNKHSEKTGKESKKGRLLVATKIKLIDEEEPATIHRVTVNEIHQKTTTSTENTQEKKLISRGFDALKRGDYNQCWSICRIIMEKKFSNGWKICKILGNSVMFEDKYAKLELLSFAIFHCEDEALTFAILASLKKLKLDILSDSLRELEQNDRDRTDMPSLTSLIPPIEITSRIVKDITALIKLDEDGKQSKLQSDPYYTSEQHLKVADSSKSNMIYESLHICPFYSDVFHKNGFQISLNKMDFNYLSTELSPSDPSILNLSRLQLQLRTELLRERVDWNSVDSICRELSYLYLSVDSTMSIACLLPLHDHSDELPFKRIESQPQLIMYLALYFYSLIFCLKRHAIQDVQASTMDEIISKAQSILKEESYLINKYHRKISNILSCQDLLSLDSNVDVDRFVDDEAYREDSLLGLAMTNDEPTFQKVVGIASHYRLSVWKLYMTYLEFLLTNVNYDVEIVASRVFRDEFINILAENDEELQNYFTNRIFPLIPDDDHNRTVLCYQIIEKHILITNILCGTLTNKISKIEDIFQEYKENPGLVIVRK